ncbi:MAG: glycerol-3-phosphate 1-O-acyltransferase PlsY [Lachnospiraceae bacterium]|nr:glycerol-3-phosphate 1-O-acyltransferase PlsY [Lachnospiraceae bacterium]
MIRLLCVAVGYIFGLFQTSYLLGKMHNIDIRNMGSGNAGTTNTLRVMGVKAGVIVLLGDVLKTVAACLLTKYLFASSYPDMRYLLILYTAAGVTLGHDFPFYMNFKGGKGIAVTAGLIIFIDPWCFLVGLVAFFVPFLLTKYVSLGSLVTYLVFVIQLIVMGQSGYFTTKCGMGQGLLIEMYVVAALLLVLAYWRHRTNIVNLLKGTERKTYLTHRSEHIENQRQGD